MSILEFFGYFGSLLIVCSALMTSIVKLRWINLCGSAIIFVYSIIISAYPVALSNFFIGSIHIYKLAKIYNGKAHFETLKIFSNDKYIENFIKIQKKEILKYFPEFDFRLNDEFVQFCILRDTSVAGIFIGKKIDEQTLFITLDFVSPQYRDFKIGKNIYINDKSMLKNYGIKVVQTYAYNKKHEKYLKKMGFVNGQSDNHGKTIFTKNL